MKISRPVVIIILILVSLVFFKIFFLSGEEQPMPGNRGKPSKYPVTVKVIREGILENKISSTGSLMSNEEVDLMPEISGRVEKIYFIEGKSVKKNDLLIKIENSDLQAVLKKTVSSLKLAEDIEGRQKKLLEINGVSQESYDMALNQVTTLKSELDFNSAQLEKSLIKAPFSGVIGLKNVSEGSFITPSVKIATLQQTDPIKINFSIPEKYAIQVQTGDNINFTVAGSDRIYKGEIYAIEPGIEQISRTLPLRALCKNPDRKLIPGSFAKIELIMHTIPNAIMIPTQALIPELKGQKVFVIKDGKALPVKVQTGIRTDSEIQITAGLTKGDSLVTSGFMQLRQGSDVQVIK